MTLTTTPEETGLTISGGMDAGTFALAMLSDEDFEERLAILKRGRERIATIQRELMIEDEDYGLIPNTPKPTLLKPGAEKLAQIYRLAARLEATFREGDNDASPPMAYDAVCFLHLGSFDGPVVASGHGTANSWEKRYRREAEKVCPKCGTKAIIKSKAEYGGGWFCWPKKGGCNNKFAPDEPAILEQATGGTGDVVGQYDLGNTLLKMAEKRAFVDAVLRATASSGLFTQDLVDEPVDDKAPRQTADYDGPSGYDDAFPPLEKPIPPVIGKSDVKGVEKGGRQSKASSAQVSSVKAYSKSLKLGPHGLIEVINSTLGADHVLNEDKALASEELLAILDAMPADALGEVIQRLAFLSEEAKATDG